MKWRLIANPRGQMCVGPEQILKPGGCIWHRECPDNEEPSHEPSSASFACTKVACSISELENNEGLTSK